MFHVAIHFGSGWNDELWRISRWWDEHGTAPDRWFSAGHRHVTCADEQSLRQRSFVWSANRRVFWLELWFSRRFPISEFSLFRPPWSLRIFNQHGWTQFRNGHYWIAVRPNCSLPIPCACLRQGQQLQQPSQLMQQLWSLVAASPPLRTRRQSMEMNKLPSTDLTKRWIHECQLPIQLEGTGGQFLPRTDHFRVSLLTPPFGF